jgi:predicted metalloprotease
MRGNLVPSTAEEIYRVLDEMGVESDIVESIILDLKEGEAWSLVKAPHYVVCEYLARSLTPDVLVALIEEARISRTAYNKEMGLRDNPSPFEDWPGDK